VNRWVRLAIIAGAIAVLAVGVVLLQSRPTEEPETTSTRSPDDRVPMLATAQANIMSIEIDSPNGLLTIARNEEGIFRPVEDTDTVWEQSEITELVNQAVALNSARKIGEVDDLAEFGLDPPYATVTVNRIDGTSQTLTLGDMNPGFDSRYALRDDDDAVYTVYNAYADRLLKTRDQLRSRDIGGVTVANLVTLEIVTLAGDDIRAEKLPDWDDDPELSLAQYVITKPYIRRQAASTTWLEEALTDLGEMAVGEYVDDEPTDLAQYGLAPPQARVTATDNNNTLDLLIGLPTEGGRYARLASGGPVFVASGVEDLISVEPYDTIGSFALIINVELVDHYELITPDETYRVSIHRDTVTTDGEEEVVETFFLNGTEIDEDLFRDLYSFAIGLQLDSDGATHSTGEPVLTINYYLIDQEEPLTLTLVDENANYLAVVRDGVAEFVMSRAKVERTLRQYAEAVANLP